MHFSALERPPSEEQGFSNIFKYLSKLRLRMMKLLATGSVKNIYVETPPSENQLGIGAFEFTNDYSVFDWGKMPQTIDDKGEALKKETVHWFNLLEEHGIKTHFIEETGPNSIKVKLSRKLGYEEIKAGKTRNYMIPLEIIFRNKIVSVGSLHRRLRKGDADPTAYGLPEDVNIAPDDDIDLPQPIVEFSTKIEEHDRYLDDEEAARLAGLTSDQIVKLKELALQVNRVITDDVRQRDLEHADGKIEVFMDPDGELCVADTVGTADENRFLYNGFDLSKQMLRNYYILIGWYDELTRARNTGQPRNRQPQPPPIEAGYFNLINDTYKALCIAITGELWGGKEPPSLDEILQQYREGLTTLQQEYGRVLSTQ